MHPTVYEEVARELRLSIAFALETIKDSELTDGPSVTVELADLRNKINVFEIMGPKASQVIRGVLKPVAEDNREDFKKVCSTVKLAFNCTDQHTVLGSTFRFADSGLGTQEHCHWFQSSRPATDVSAALPLRLYEADGLLMIQIPSAKCKNLHRRSISFIILGYEFLSDIDVGTE